MSAIVRELRRLRRLVSDQDKRIARTTISGKVAEIDHDKRMVRLAIDEDDDGKPVLGPWARWEEPAVGTLTMHTPPKVGQQMAYHSPSGVLGSGSVARTRTYDDDTQAPSKAGDAAMIALGGSSITFGASGITIETATIHLKGNVMIEGNALTHNDVNVGDDHKHTEVIKGPDKSGPPES